jgi:uncharacterized protein YutE (UPF0331/DUF86 family)
MITDKSVEEMVAAYRKIREAISEKEEAHKADISGLREQLDIVSDALLGICNSLQADSLRTAAGTVSRRVNTRYWTTDWERMYEFIRENDVPFLLEQRIHNGNMKQFLDENPDSLPIGLQADRKFVIQVRKPTGK